MKYCRINLDQTNYSLLSCASVLYRPNIEELQLIYKKYCDYKRFESVMPIFDSEFTDSNNDVIAYEQGGRTVAFSLIRRYDDVNAEAIQFAWDYSNPNSMLGLESLKHECAYYKQLGFKYLYLGAAAEYKSKVDGYEQI